MKMRLSIVAVLLIFVAVTAHAQEKKIRVGMNLGYSNAGDVEDSNVGLGLQAEFPVNQNLGIELALSRFSDEYEDSGVSIEQELTSIGLSAVLRAPFSETATGYFLAGIDYNTVDMDADLDTSWSSGVEVEADIDNEFGFHLGFGAGFAVHKNLEIIVEYRYTILELEGDISASYRNMSISDDVEGDYDFGLLKVGVNYLF